MVVKQSGEQSGHQSAQSNGEQGQQQDGQQSGQQGGQGEQGQHEQHGQGQQSQGLGLLNEQDENGGEGSGESSEQDGNQSGTGQSQGLTAEQVQTRIESALDRRINVVLREIRGGQNQGQQQQGQQSGQQQQPGNQQNQQGPGNQQQQTSDRVDPATERDARATYREFVNDQIKFLGSEEREHALGIAAGMIASGLSEGGSPDRVGMEVAGKVAGQIKALRTQYENATVAALRRKGMLKETGEGPGHQRPGSASQPSGQSTFAAGQSKAKEMYADRIQQ